MKNTDKLLRIYELWHKASLGAITEEEYYEGQSLEVELEFEPRLDTLIARAQSLANIEKTIAGAMETFQTGFQQVGDLCSQAVVVPGEERKQWYLEQIAALLGFELPPHEPGISPEDE
jgi:hypothetical protein